MQGSSNRPRLALRAGECMRIGGAHDALSAVLLAEAGFPAIWVSSFAVSAAQFALPDINLVSMSESVEAAKRIAMAVSVPVIVDADNGFGDANNAARAVREYGMAGVAGVCIEDNTFPKRSSLYPGAPRELVSIDEMCGKLAAAKAAGAPHGVFLIGRVESLIAGLGPDDALARANAYAQAGADAVLIHSRAFAPLRDLAASGKLTKPLIAVPTLFGDTPFAAMAAAGIAGVICANQVLRAMVGAVRPMARALLSADALSDLDASLVPVKAVNELVKVPEDWSQGAWRTCDGAGAPAGA